jgi:hypothetical protein
MKARSDSPLKNLPEERQEQIVEWCNTLKTADCAGGYKFAKEQLAADGIKASEGALSEFYSWWHLRRDFQRNDSLTRDFEELLKKEFPAAAPGKIQEFGQTFFTMQAAAKRDSKEFREMEYLRLSKETGITKARQKDQELALATRRVELLERKIAEATETVESSKLSDAQKAERLREIFKK